MSPPFIGRTKFSDLLIESVGICYLDIEQIQCSAFSLLRFVWDRIEFCLPRCSSCFSVLVLLSRDRTSRCPGITLRGWMFIICCCFSHTIVSICLVQAKKRGYLLPWACYSELFFCSFVNGDWFTYWDLHTGTKRLVNYFCSFWSKTEETILFCFMGFSASSLVPFSLYNISMISCLFQLNIFTHHGRNHC